MLPACEPASNHCPGRLLLATLCFQTAALSWSFGCLAPCAACAAVPPHGGKRDRSHAYAASHACMPHHDRTPRSCICRSAAILKLHCTCQPRTGLSERGQRGQPWGCAQLRRHRPRHRRRMQLPALARPRVWQMSMRPSQWQRWSASPCADGDHGCGVGWACRAPGAARARQGEVCDGRRVPSRVTVPAELPVQPFQWLKSCLNTLVILSPAIRSFRPTASGEVTVPPPKNHPKTHRKLSIVI